MFPVSQRFFRISAPRVQAGSRSDLTLSYCGNAGLPLAADGRVREAVSAFFQSALLLTGLLAGSHASAASASAPAAAPEQKPLWELGAGVGVLYAPDYPGSSEHHLRGLALPYIIYRGDVFRLGDGQTARAVAFETNRLEFNLSFDAAFDADSENNELREGMNDLDFMFQLGPQLSIRLADFKFAEDSRSELFLALQTRAVFSSDLKRIDQRGYVFEPMVRYKHYGLLTPKLDATISLRPLWASEQLHAYFFDVESQFATPDRPQYEAESGYFGTGLNFYASYQMTEKASVFLGVQTNSLQGAANRDSPLHQKDFTVAFGAGFVWAFLASKKLVTVP